MDRAAATGLVPAALLGRWLGDAFGDSYAWRAGLYSVLLVYVVVGAGVLFVKVAQHETMPLSFGRVARWFTSLWLWPLLLLASRKR